MRAVPSPRCIPSCPVARVPSSLQCALLFLAAAAAFDAVAALGCLL